MVFQVAEQKKDFDLLRRIKGYDPFACEAQYHRAAGQTCIKAFSNVCAIIDEYIILKKAVLKLDCLRGSMLKAQKNKKIQTTDLRLQISDIKV